MQLADIFHWERTAGEPITVGDVTLTPESQALSLRLPIGGFVWNRPAAVLVDGDGGQRRVPIVDVTRAAQLTLLAAAALFVVLGLLLGRRRAPL